MRQATISTDFWDDEKIRRCDWMEKLIMLHLLTRKRMTNIGYIEIELDDVARKINSTNSSNREGGRTPIKASEIKAGLDSLRRRRIIMLKTEATAARHRVSIYFLNFLRHKSWPPSVARSWPDIIRAAAPPAKIDKAIRETCVAFCKERGMDVPRGLAPRRR
jgi:hypothetical protein